MKLGSRIFSPQPFTTGVAILVFVVLVALGRWQLQRAAERQTLFDQFDRGTDATLPIEAGTPPLQRYQHVEARGTYDPSRQLLIDNMFDGAGRAGYYVITPFALVQGGWLLVNRGWVPVGASRAELPVVGVTGNVRGVHGRVDHLPSPGIQMGDRRELRPPYPIVAAFPSHTEIERLMPGASWNAGAEVVLLDADQADGYVRQWHAPGFPPARNLAYAVQWFGLAIALLVIYAMTNLHRAPDATIPS